jgi:hypothetical protein
MTTLYNRARVSTATAGTGTMTLGAAVSAAFFTFAEAGVPDGAEVSYVIEDGTDVEMGTGTYTVSGTTLSRDTVTSSKIGGTAGTTKLTLSGSAVVFIDALAADMGREVLTANRTYYVRSDGNDANTGRANSSGGAWLTLQHAVFYIAENLDIAGFNITISVGAGTFAGFGYASLTGGGTLGIVGAGAASTIIEDGPNDGIYNFGECICIIQLIGPTLLYVNNVTLDATSTYTAIAIYKPNFTFQVGNVDNTSALDVDVIVPDGGTAFSIYNQGFFAIQASAGGGAVNFSFATSSAYDIFDTSGYVYLFCDAPLVVTETPAFSNSFAYIGENVWAKITNVSGAATGPRFIVQPTGYLQTETNDLTYLPGNAAGTIAVGGQYDNYFGDFAHAMEIAEETAATNTVTQLLRLTSTSSGTPAAGIGAGIEFQVETAAANNEIGAIAEAYVKDATSTSEDFGWRVKTMTAGQTAATSLDISLPGTAYPQGHIFGLTLSNDTDTANDINITAGEAVDETGVWNMVLPSEITKRIDGSNWVVGNDQDGLNTGNEAAGWYEVILIGREDTRVVDVMFSTTANRATLPANYTHKRRIGWAKRNPGNTSFEQFIQIDDHFTLITAINDASITATATAAAITVTVPPSAIGRFRISSDSNTDNAVNQVTIFQEIVEGVVTPSDATGLASIGCHDIAGSQAGHIELRVSATSTIEHDSSHTANVVDVSTFGWIDHRRRMSAT